MSANDDVVIGKLKLKGKGLDDKAGGIRRKKKHDKSYESRFVAVDFIVITDSGVSRWMDCRLHRFIELGSSVSDLFRLGKCCYKL
ncbi:hypothetical protein L6164_024235 [Bauhinia variegata]|uniref:Uncharacterized protein n=1 Tax=Bauhinia variegata TaxID=167791 RepID=A0ACB9LX61_BAUVA|nr:hypothetical protein L6164_024235 [Bauhinia variegata]